MKFRIKNLSALIEKGESEYNGDNTPIAIIFKDDKERVKFATHILNMPPKEGERWFVQSPDNYSKKELAEFMEMPEEDLNTQPTKNILG